MIDRINKIWCNMMHDSPMWPIHGHYECRTCGREFPVNWGTEPKEYKSRQPVATMRLARVSK